MISSACIKPNCMKKITQKRKAILVIVYRSRNIVLIVCDEAWQATDSFRWLIKRREKKSLLSFTSFVFAF